MTASESWPEPSPHDYSRKLLTGLLVTPCTVFIAIMLLGLLFGQNSASVNHLLLVWPRLGAAGFFGGVIAQAIWLRKTPPKSA